VNNGKTLRIILTGAIAALVAVVPVAEAKSGVSSDGVYVCNMATPNSQNGDLAEQDTPTRFSGGGLLKSKPGQGAGLLNAAKHSPALTACARPSDDGGDEDDTTVVVPPDTSIIVS